MACRFQSPTIVGWMPCFVANCAVVSSPRSASSATFALNSTEYRCRLLVIQVRPSQERTELKPLSKFAVPPHNEAAAVKPAGRQAARIERLQQQTRLRARGSSAGGGGSWQVPE